MSESNREAIVGVLQEKFDQLKAKDYEERIFNMCSTLSEDVFEDSIEEIYKYYAYEKVGQLLNSPDIDEVLDDIKQLRIGEKSFYRRKMEIKKPKSEGPLIRRGVFPCFAKGCRARYTKETIFTMRQLRSGDEGMTAIVKCRVCGKQYKL